MAEHDTAEIRSTVRRTCQRLAVTVEQAGRATARALERKSVELKLSELYEALGRLLYKKLRSETEDATLTEKISATMTKIEKCESYLEKLRVEAVKDSPDTDKDKE